MKNKLKINITIGCLIALGVTAILAGCSTTQQRATYNTIATIEATATAGVDGYYTAVLKGLVTTNGVPEVSKAYNDLQAAATLAASVAESGTNALAPSSLIIEASNLGSLITTLETK